MTKQELIKKLEDQKILDTQLFEQPIDLKNFRIVQYQPFEDDDLQRDEIASCDLSIFLEEADETLWNPNGDDTEEFLNDFLWD